MAQIRGFIPLTRRRDALGVPSLGHFGPVVLDVEEAARFYAGSGLEMAERDGGLQLRTVGGDRRWGALAQAGRKQLPQLSLPDPDRKHEEPGGCRRAAPCRAARRRSAEDKRQ